MVFRSSFTPKGVLACEKGQALSSTPEACGVLFIIRAEGACFP